MISYCGDQKKNNCERLIEVKNLTYLTKIYDIYLGSNLCVLIFSWFSGEFVDYFLKGC